MDQWDVIRSLARAKRREIHEHARSEHAFDLISAAAEVTGIKCIPVPKDDPLLYGSDAVLAAEDKRIRYNKEVDPLILSGYLIHEYAHYWIEGENVSCAQPDFEARLREEKTLLGTNQVDSYNPRERREALANVFAREFLLPADRLQKWFVHEQWSASQIAIHVGVTETLVFNQLTDLLLVYANDQEMAELPVSSKHVVTELDSSQVAAAHATTGPLLVEAGPGTGKTKTLVGRIQFLILQEHVDPESILVLTFSNKAADEMRARLADVLPDIAPAVWMGTFHAFGLELLRKYGHALGFPAEPHLLDPINAILLIEQLLPQVTLNHYQDLYEPARNVPDFLNAISRAKDELVTPDKYRQMAAETYDQASDDEQRERAEKILEVAGVYDVYQAHLNGEHLIDFGDLIARSVHLLENHPDVKQDVQSTFHHILVDEYQDVNRASAVFLQQLAGDGKGLWVVGDARQSIYRFRGASPQNMAFFPYDFPGAITMPLQVNYRSQRPVVEMFATLAKQMKIPTMLPFVEWEPNRADVDGKSILVEADSLQQEGEFIAYEIGQLLKQGIHYKDQAILCRSHTQLAKIAAIMEQHGIPTLYLGDLFERPEIKDLLGLLGLVTGDGRGLVRISKFTEYRLSSSDVHNVFSLADDNQIPFPEAIEQFENHPSLTVTGQAALRLINTHLQKSSRSNSAWFFLAHYLFNASSYLRTILQLDDNTHYHQRIAIYQFLRFVYDQGKAVAGSGDPKRRLLDYVRRLEIHGEEKQLSQIPEAGHSLNAVRLLTIHASKGLEFRAVYVPMLGKGYFPSKMQGQTCYHPKGLVAQDLKQLHLDEEICLFFVALSRARDVLYLSRATRYGSRGSNPSDFLALVSSALTRIKPARATTPAKPTSAVENQQDEDFKTVSSSEFEVEQLDMYSRCPRRYYYDLVLDFSRNTEDSPFLRFHRCVYQIVDWIEAGYIQNGSADISAALAKLDALWPAANLTGHPFDPIYRKTAEQMIAAAVQLYSGARTFKKKQSIPLQLKNGTVHFWPDQVEIGENGQQIWRRIRTGQLRPDESGQTVYALYHAAAMQTTNDAFSIEVMSLTTGTSLPIELNDHKAAERLAEYDQAMGQILQGVFPAAPKDRRHCPRCPNYFICPTIPSKQTTTQ